MRWPLAHAALLFLPERRPQLALENLAGAGQRQRLLADVDTARALVAGDQGLGELDQFAGRDLRAALGHHHGMHLLAPVLMRDADHGALRHRGMAGDGVLDLDRVDVLAAGNDHVLDPVNHIDEAVVVHVAAVTGVHPAVDHGAGGFVRPLPVTHHHIVAAHDDLADGAIGDGLVVGIDNAHLAAEGGAAGAAVTMRTSQPRVARPAPR